MSESCVFCRIAVGEIPAEVIRSDDEFIAFRDTDPRAKTHVLVIPREHHEHIDAFVQAGGATDRMLAFASATAEDLDIAGNYRLITNVGANAGQVVFHLHWHILSGSKLPGFQ